MIPLSLTIRNFLSYGAESQTLDFRGLHVLCLSGQNGHGKSALLDAMTWALFGQARARTDDELVHHGATEMQVVFDLELNGTAYRVSRLRTSKGKTRLTHLDALVAETEGTWRTLNGNSVRETERIIEQLLGMNYQTFINSAFLLQGRADEFTVKPPSERKKVLADVLNLDVYERLSLRAKERRQQWQLASSTIQAEVADLDRQLAHLPDARATLAQAEERRGAVNATLPPAEAHLQQLRSDQQRMEQRRQEQEHVQRRLAEVQAQMRDHDQRIALQQMRLDTAIQTLAERDAVERDYACWQRQRAVVAEQTNRLVQLQPLFREQQSLQRTIDQAGHDLRQQVAELRGKLESCVQEAAKGREADRLLDTVLAELTALADTPERRSALQQRQGELREAVAGLKVKNEGLELTLNQLRGRYQALGSGDTPCPICAQPLSPAQREELRTSMKAEADQRKAERQENRALIDRHDADLKQLSRELSDLEKQTKRLEQAKRDEATLREKIRAAECASTQSQQWQQDLTVVATRLEGEEYAGETRQQLAVIAGQIAEIAYDGALHRKAEQVATALAPVEAKRRQLDEAHQIRATAEEQLDQLRSSLKSWEQQEVDWQARRDALQQELAGADAIAHQCREQEQAVQQLKADQLAAAGAVAAAEQVVAHLEACRQRKEERLGALKDAQDQQAIYVHLQDAFGRNGVQAMLIDEAIPLIEEEANKLLAAMTDGRLNISLETQRLTQKQATVETLDVRISDELGTRNYELYSGGEAFRVDFALRIALSRLLAHRAGTRLQTLVIDEGFGSQDETGRDRMHAALRTVADDFACIIVITHLDEMKEWFTNRVEVVKDGSGSHLRVVAA